MQIFGQKIVFHSSKRVNSIVKQHKLNIWLDIKTIIVSVVFIYIQSIFLLLESHSCFQDHPDRQVQCKGNKNSSVCSSLFQLVFGVPLPYARKNKSKQDILPADDFTVKGITNSCKMYISSACSYCRCIHTFSHIKFSLFFLFVL